MSPVCNHNRVKLYWNSQSGPTFTFSHHLCPEFAINEMHIILIKTTKCKHQPPMNNNQELIALGCVLFLSLDFLQLYVYLSSRGTVMGGHSVT